MKQLPHDAEAERVVLASFLFKDELFFESILTSEDFYIQINKIIFETMQEMIREINTIDPILLINELDKKNKLKEIGGVEYITCLNELVTDDCLFSNSVKSLKDNKIRRKLIETMERVSDLAYNKEAEKAYALIEKEISNLCEKQERKEENSFKDDLTVTMKRLKENSTNSHGVLTPFNKLNEKLKGFQKKDLIIIGARPGQGKTSLAMNFISYASLQKHSCAIFSLEMPAKQLAKRMLCSVANVSLERANTEKLSQAEWKRIIKAKSLLDCAKIWINDCALITPYEILNQCRRIKRQHGLDLVVVDYLQLITLEEKSENRQLEISKITRTLKIVAKDLDVPIILLSQLSRDIEKRENKRPQMSDLRESGAIEQDADVIIFIYKDEKQMDNSAELILAKHRNGELGNVKVIFNKDTTTFFDCV